MRSRSVVAVLSGLALAAASLLVPVAAHAAPPSQCVSVSEPYNQDGRISGTELIPAIVQDAADEPPTADLFVDGVLVATDAEPWPVSEGGCGIIYTFEFAWDTTLHTDGPHELQARGNQTASGAHYWSNKLTLVVDS